MLSLLAADAKTGTEAQKDASIENSRRNFFRFITPLLSASISQHRENIIKCVLRYFLLVKHRLNVFVKLRYIHRKIYRTDIDIFLPEKPLDKGYLAVRQALI